MALTGIAMSYPQTPVRLSNYGIRIRPGPSSVSVFKYRRRQATGFRMVTETTTHGSCRDPHKHQAVGLTLSSIVSPK